MPTLDWIGKKAVLHHAPDFVAEMVDGRRLVVEHKGEHLWSNDDSKEKRAVGELWANAASDTAFSSCQRGQIAQRFARPLKLHRVENLLSPGDGQTEQSILDRAFRGSYERARLGRHELVTVVVN